MNKAVPILGLGVLGAVLLSISLKKKNGNGGNGGDYISGQSGDFFYELWDFNWKSSDGSYYPSGKIQITNTSTEEKTVTFWQWYSGPGITAQQIPGHQKVLAPGQITRYDFTSIPTGLPMPSTLGDYSFWVTDSFAGSSPVMIKTL